MTECKHYVIDVWQDESIWSWAGLAEDDATAQEYARQGLNEDWNCEYETWDDLAEDMGGTATRVEDAATVRSGADDYLRDEAPALLAALRRLASAADGDIYTDAPECADSVREALEAQLAAEAVLARIGRTA